MKRTTEVYCRMYIVRTCVVNAGHILISQVNVVGLPFFVVEPKKNANRTYPNTENCIKSLEITDMNKSVTSAKTSILNIIYGQKVTLNCKIDKNEFDIVYTIAAKQMAKT